jgi:hypothetical protein
MTNHRRLAALLWAALGLLAGEARAELVAENLLTAIPDGFEIGFQTREGSMDMMEFIPKGESVKEWTSMITVQIFHDLGKQDSDVFARRVAEMWKGGCKDSAAERLGAGTANGYPAAAWHYWCPLNTQTGKPEEMWLEAISGNDALYVVQYAYRADATDKMELQALNYLAAASVCDTRITERACPAGM